MCVPLNDKETGIKAPSSIMMNHCRKKLLTQIEIINPEVIITLGSKAYENVCKVLDIPKRLHIRAKDMETVTSCVKNKTTYQIDGLTIILEIHLSPLTAINPQSKELYYGLEERLVGYDKKYI